MQRAAELKMPRRRHLHASKAALVVLGMACPWDGIAASRPRGCKPNILRLTWVQSALLSIVTRRATLSE